MAAVLREIVVDCTEPGVVAAFWSAVLGWPVTDDPRGYAWLSSTGTPMAPPPLLVFVPVPEAKTVKNRMHIDVIGDTDALLAAGATLLRPRTVRPEGEPEQEEDIEHDVLADPEGNEFCVLGPHGG